MASGSSSSSSLSVEARQSVTAFLAGAYEDEKASLVEVDLPIAIKSNFLTSPPSLRLVDFIKHLGPSFTSEDEVERSRAVVLLSLVVTTLAAEEATRTTTTLFDKQATTTLSLFFSSKIEDGNVVAASIAQRSNDRTEMIPGSAPEYRRKKYPEGTEMLVASVRALTTLAKLNTFASEAAKASADGLVRHSSPRVHPQAIRFLIYLLMDTLLSRHRSALKSMGDSFLKGYLELVEGEKDPRNLVYIFAMDRVLLVEWEMDKEMVEAFFDVTYCYFPITFRPPPDDPYGISTNTLRLALRRALTASPLLAPHALPLLIEKLQASGGNAKRDTLETLGEVMPVFGRSACLAHIKELWEGFKIEIMHATDEATAICSMSALESLLYVLYVGEEEAEGVATEMVADMLDELEEPSKQQAKPAGQILAAMIRATPATASLATFAALDQLFTMYKEPEDPSVRGAILEHTNSIIRALRETYDGADRDQTGKREEVQAKEEGRFTFEKPASSTLTVGKNVEGKGAERTYSGDGRPLDKFRDALLNTLSHGLKTSSTRVAAVDLFVTLSHIDFLEPQELRHLCDSVNELLIDGSADQVRVQTLDGLRDLGNKRVIEESTLPLLFGLLPDRISASSSGSDGKEAQEKVKGDIRRALGALARLCDSSEFFDMLIVRLSTKLDFVFVAAEEQEANVGYARGLIGTITVVLEEKMKRMDRDTARYGNLVPRLIGNIIEASLRTGSGQGMVGRDRKVIRDVGRLVTLLVRCLNQTKQADVSVGLQTALFHGDLAYLSHHSSILARHLSSSHSTLDLFSRSTSSAQRDTLYCFSSALVALKKDVPGPSGEGKDDHLDRLLQWTLASKTQLQEQGGSALLANGVNKHVGEPVPSGFTALLDSLWSDEVEARERMEVDGQRAEAVHRQRRAVRIWLVMARGLLVRNSETGRQMMDRILSLFAPTTSAAGSADQVARPDSVVKEAARGLGRVTSEDEVLCKENGAVIRLLYKQRFVTFILPKLLEGFQRSRTTTPASAATNGSSPSSTQSIYLIAICSLLPSLPRATLLDKLTEIFPLLIMALDLHDDEAVKAGAANVITLAVAVGKQEKDERAVTTTVVNGSSSSSDGFIAASKPNSLTLVQDHMAAILKRLLFIVSLSSSAGTGSTGPKIAALRCLAMVARSMDYPSLHPHRVTVLKVLGQRGAGVDDGKRTVRVEAVEARDAWYNLKGAGEGAGEDD